MADWGERALSAYVGASRLGVPVGRAVLAWRRLRHREHALRWRERLGIAVPRQGEGTLVWVHAASVGETVAILPVIRRIVEAGLRVVLTTVTVTAARLAERQLPAGAVHQFVPLDLRPCVDAFLERWRPALALLVESEIWPVTIARLAAARVPVVVANGRMSERSFARWSKARGIAAPLFGRLRLCLAQTEGDAERFRRLGVPRVAAVGNLKFGAPVPEAEPDFALPFARAVAGRPVLLAASTHAGEDIVVLDAFAKLAETRPDLLLVLAPRHPERGAELMTLAVARHFHAAQRSVGAVPDAMTSVFVADAIGELGTYLRAATVAFVGGSLRPHGGHNPIEPASYGVPVVSGPEVANFREIYAALTAACGVRVVGGAQDLVDAAGDLLDRPEVRAAHIEAARRVIGRYTGALERTLDAIEPFIGPLAVSERLARTAASA